MNTLRSITGFAAGFISCFWAYYTFQHPHLCLPPLMLAATLALSVLLIIYDDNPLPKE